MTLTCPFRQDLIVFLPVPQMTGPDRHQHQHHRQSVGVSAPDVGGGGGGTLQRNSNPAASRAPVKSNSATDMTHSNNVGYAKAKVGQLHDETSALAGQLDTRHLGSF